MGRGPGHGSAFPRLMLSLPSEEECPESSALTSQRVWGRIRGASWHCQVLLVWCEGLAGERLPAQQEGGRCCNPPGLGEHPQNPRNGPEKPLRSSGGEAGGSGPGAACLGGIPPVTAHPLWGLGRGKRGHRQALFPPGAPRRGAAPLPLAPWPEAAACLRAGTRRPPGKGRAQHFCSAAGTMKVFSPPPRNL